jgi:hypothetical protein
MGVAGYFQLNLDINLGPATMMVRFPDRALAAHLRQLLKRLKQPINGVVHGEFGRLPCHDFIIPCSVNKATMPNVRQ